MATNVRGDLVVDPQHLAEFDRLTWSSPVAVLACGTGLFIVAAVSAVAYPLGALTVIAVMLGLAALATSALIAVRLAARKSNRVRLIARDLEPLRECVLFDEHTVPDDLLWVAAGMAVELAELDERNERLAGAAARTPAQENAYEEYESDRAALGERILTLVSYP